MGTGNAATRLPASMDVGAGAGTGCNGRRASAGREGGRANAGHNGRRDDGAVSNRVIGRWVMGRRGDGAMGNKAMGRSCGLVCHFAAVGKARCHFSGVLWTRIAKIGISADD